MGDLRLPPTTAGFAGTASADVDVPVLVELNVLFPGGLGAVREAFYAL